MQNNLIWLGAGASKACMGSNTPLTSDFFDNEGVRNELEKYLFLNYVYERFKHLSLPLDNLEVFWSMVDEICNDIRSPDEARREKALFYSDISYKEMQNLMDESVKQHKILKNYYEFYKNETSRYPCLPEDILLVIAGWELENLIVKIYDRKITESGKEMFVKNLIEPLKIKQKPELFTILSFNYDTLFEQVLKSEGINFFYSGNNEENKKDRNVEVIKPHGSINLKANKKCDGLPNWCRDSFKFEKSLESFKPNLNFDGYKFSSEEPQVVGLRYKRELLGKEYDKGVEEFFGHLLFKMRKSILEAGKIYIIGFSFQQADAYLWFIAKEISSKNILYKKIRCCNKISDEKEIEQYKERVKRFFNSNNISFYFCGLENFNLNHV